jgi:hypothetical protein
VGYSDSIFGRDRRILSTPISGGWKGFPHESFLTYLVIGLFSALAVVYYGVAHAELMTEDSVKKLPTGADDAEKISSPMGVILGLRAGAAIPTEKVLKNTGNGTSIGPVVNAEALYAIQEWVRLVLMLEWHQHGKKQHEEMGFHEGWNKALDQLVAYVKTL